MTTVTAEQIAELVEALTKWAKIQACEDPFLAGAEDAGETLYGQAVEALTALSDQFADAGKMIAALQERVEGLEGERDEWKTVAKGEAHNRIAHKARADALSAELEGLKKGSSSSRDHEHSTCSALELEYAQRLATVAATFYGPPAGWRPLPDLCGVLTQIDNALTGLCRAPSSAEQVVGDSTRDTKNHPSTNGEG